MVSGILAGGAGGAGINIIISAIDNYSKEFNKLSDAVKQQQTGFQKLTGFLKSSGIGYAALAGASVGFAIDSVKSFLKTEQAAQSFNIVVGETANILLKDLRVASKGMVSDFNLMQSANKALMLGIDKNQLPQLMEMSAALGKVMGRTVTEAFGDITIGIGRQSKLILDNLGIIVNAEDAYKRYATELGKTADALTDVEKKLAFTNEVIKQGTALTEAMRYATETHTEKLQRLSAGWENVKSTTGEAIVEAYDWLVSLGKTVIAYDLWAEDIKSPEVLAQLQDIGNEMRTIYENTNSLREENEAYIKDLGELVKTTFPKEIELKKERIALEEKLASGYNKTREAISSIEEELKSSRSSAESLLSSLRSVQVTLRGESEKNIDIIEKEKKINESKLKIALGGGEEEEENLKRLQKELEILRLQKEIDFNYIKDITQANNEMYVTQQQGIIQTVDEFMKSNDLKKQAYSDELTNIEGLKNEIDILKSSNDYMSDAAIEGIKKQIDSIDEELRRFDTWREKQNLNVEGWKLMKDESSKTFESIESDIQTSIDKYEENILKIGENTKALDALQIKSKELADVQITDAERRLSLFKRIWDIQKILPTGPIIDIIAKSKGIEFEKGGLVPGPKGKAMLATVHGGEYVISEPNVNKSVGGTEYYITITGDNYGIDPDQIAESLANRLNSTIYLN